MRTPYKWLKDEGIFSYNYWHLIWHPWIVPKEMYYNMKWFIQRGKRGWSDQDAWSMDYYLSRIIPEMLIDQYTDVQGTPMAMFLPGDFSEDGNPTDQACGIRHNEWLDILDKIRKGFEAHRSIQEFDFYVEGNHEETMRIQAVLQAKVDSGLLLFAKYFQSLWN